MHFIYRYNCCTDDKTRLLLFNIIVFINLEENEQNNSSEMKIAGRNSIFPPSGIRWKSFEIYFYLFANLNSKF